MRDPEADGREDYMRCERCGESKRTVTARSYNSWTYLLCLDCRLHINRILLDEQQA